MTDTKSKSTENSLKERMFSSSILRVAIFLFLLSLFNAFVSPKLEGIIVQKVSKLYRENSFSEINSLSPIFDIYAYAQDYDLSTYSKTEDSYSKTKFFTIDPRVLALNKFLDDYHSPMAKYAKTFVEEADKYGLDWRLLASISGVESAFGNLIPDNSNNGWGWRGINGNEAGWSMFSSWQEAISHITQRIAEGYGTDLTPFDIEPTYCPPCAENSEHAWANGVNNYMNQLEYYVNNLNEI